PSTGGACSCASAKDGKIERAAIAPTHALVKAARQDCECCRRVEHMSVPQPRKQAGASAGKKHLIFGVEDAVTDDLIETIGDDQSERHSAQLISSRLCWLAFVTDLGAQVVITGRRRLADRGNIVLREGMKQPHAREPCVIPPIETATNAHRRNARHV